jgi:LPS-assembly protein
MPLPSRIAPLLALVAAAWPGGAALAQGEPGIVLQTSPLLTPPPGGELAKRLPIIVRARELRGRPDIETVAEGDAEFRRGTTLIRADRLAYDHPDDLASARGNVRVSRDGNVYAGSELQLHVQRFEGFFANPTYHFSRTGAGGTAKRFDFLDDQRSVATGATYTSCPSDGSGGPAWLLSTDRVKLDFEANEGIAENAVLRFYGVPILGLPVLSFPLTDARKSGWLPPSLTIDSRSGVQFSIPYYWNIAPNRDATITPITSVKRGFGADSEFRYLEPGYSGQVALLAWPKDQLRDEQRFALRQLHEGQFDPVTPYRVRVLRVSDDNWWKDFPGEVESLTPRLLASEAALQRALPAEWSAYARIQRWQVLQDVDSASRIVAPYERLPQIGVRTLQRFQDRYDLAFETEVNRFGNPSNGIDGTRPTGTRWHAIGSLAGGFDVLAGRFTPKVAFNAASYSLDEPLDGRRSRSRVVPTFSLDAHWQLERDTRWFGRDTLQTLEPRLLYVRTPFRAQDPRLNFDSAVKDFNIDSIYSENAFSGIDRVSDAHSLTAGVTSRLIDPASGAESVRFSVVQRYLFRDQRITTELTDDAVPQFVPFTQRFSDVLLLGSSNLIPRWTLDAAVQYNPDIQRTVRSILSARYSPGPYRTVNASYRLARGLSEQLELGWQWPLAGLTPPERETNRLRVDGDGKCRGSWYGVGRINYSTRDSRVTDSIIGLEYDSGCWIGRIVSERLSTGRSEATTRLLLQLELVGLSRLGSNPLGVLKDNIPGYKLLRDERPPGAGSGASFND